MPAFTPCIGTRAQVDARPVRDGQMLVAADTGEVFIDFNGVRIRVTGSSGGGETPHGDDDDDDSLLTGWAVVNAALLVSDSVQGGGPGAVDQHRIAHEADAEQHLPRREAADPG